MGHVPPIVGRIPGMKMRDLVRLWRNAVRILADEKKRQQYGDANLVLKAINKEWLRRRGEPVNAEEIFDWPSTVADGGSGELGSERWLQQGVLQFVGYHVGAEGEQQRTRERILAEVLKGEIPPVFPPDYLRQWGEPGTVLRLQKLAETIAALTRNAKRRRDARMDAATRDWESDLEYLYYEFYVGKFYFIWPDSSV